jgi:hypothetical protein|tara:strand:- start:1389 stop:1898 length:510 start_codon:yes stop_codon:yes gene_type:complete
MKNILIILLSFPITLVLYILLFSGNIKYSEEIVINANIDTVIALFDNPYNMQKYMEGIESYKIVEGNIREVGAKAEITVLMGEKKIIMIEKIITNNLPEHKKVTYTADAVINIVTNKFIKVSENKTKFINEQEFEFKGYMKIIGFFMPSAFNKQSRVYLKDFKEFAENH